MAAVCPSGDALISGSICSPFVCLSCLESSVPPDSSACRGFSFLPPWFVYLKYYLFQEALPDHRRPGHAPFLGAPISACVLCSYPTAFPAYWSSLSLICLPTRLQDAGGYRLCLIQCFHDYSVFGSEKAFQSVWYCGSPDLGCFSRCLPWHALTAQRWVSRSCLSHWIVGFLNTYCHHPAAPPPLSLSHTVVKLHCWTGILQPTLLYVRKAFFT